MYQDGNVIFISAVSKNIDNLHLRQEHHDEDMFLYVHYQVQDFSG